MAHFEQKPIPQDYYEVVFCLEESMDGGKTIAVRAEFTPRTLVASLNDLPLLIQRMQAQIRATLPCKGCTEPLQMQDNGRTLATPWDADLPKDDQTPRSWFRYVLYLYRIERTEIPDAMVAAAIREVQG